jgi:AcrR family transcriptional regulator
MPARFSDHRLPPGRHGLTTEMVAENQRWRLLGAAAEVLAECGYAATTSTRIARRAGVSSSTLYRHFGGVDVLLTASFELSSAAIAGLVEEACEQSRDPEATLSTLLAFSAAERPIALLLAPAAAVAIAPIAAERAQLLDRLAARLRRRGQSSPEGGTTARRWLIAAAIALVCERLAAGAEEDLAGLAPELAALLAAV